VSIGVDGPTGISADHLAVQRLDAILAAAQDAIMTESTDGTLLAWNPAAERLFGWTADEMIGRSGALLVPVSRLPELDVLAAAAVRHTVTTLETTRLRRDGTEVEVSLTVSPFSDPATDQPLGASIIIRDMSPRRDAEATLHHQTRHDPLTGLPNRTFLLERVEQDLASHQHVAVLFVDLDDFKLVNDTHDHATGDRMLITVAERLQTQVKRTDLVARFGGDEFVVVCPGLDNDIDARALAVRLAEHLQGPMEVDGRTMVITVSVGIAVGGPGSTGAGILRDAAAAMYHAKADSRAHTAVFDQSFRDQSRVKLEVSTALREALASGSLELAYQPLLDIENGRVIGLEALARWNHPVLGSVSPLTFIPVAEENRLILPLGEWALREACAALRRLHDGGFPWLIMSVNLSAHQIQQSSVVEQVAEACEDAGVQPSSLLLEITESALLKDLAGTVHTLERLRTLGCLIGLDDFGTGYSSLSYLKQLPLDVVKIDRSFVSGLALEEADAAVISAVVRVSNSLKFEVLAEGVETGSQLLMGLSLGCRYAQGYLFSRPLPETELAGFLQDWDPLTAMRGGIHGDARIA
jgi:diguanylate cyclase (GGDEF)-like protein/PAS domain S-box-containing protein